MPVKLFSEPHPYSASLKMRLLLCLIFSVFVFLFLWIFQPFGLSTLPQGVAKVALGYGGVCFTIMFLLNIVCMEALPAIFNESKWTLGKQLIWIALNIVLVGLGNAIYTSYILGWKLSFQVIGYFELYTVAVGVIPSSVLIMLGHKRDTAKYNKEAQQLSNNLVQKETQKGNAITISSENKGEELTLEANNILYINSADNYIEVHFLLKGIVQKQVLRNTLKQVEEETKNHTQLMRCHRGYMVNINRVNKISGNAQGYKLHFSETDIRVPVSRNLSHTLKEKLLVK